MLIGLGVGLLIGLIQPYTMGYGGSSPVEHGLLILKMGLAFSLLALLLTRYYEARMKMYRKLLEHHERSSQQENTPDSPNTLTDPDRM